MLTFLNSLPGRLVLALTAGVLLGGLLTIQLRHFAGRKMAAPRGGPTS